MEASKPLKPSCPPWSSQCRQSIQEAEHQGSSERDEVCRPRRLPLPMRTDRARHGCCLPTRFISSSRLPLHSNTEARVELPSLRDTRTNSYVSNASASSHNRRTNLSRRLRSSHAGRLTSPGLDSLDVVPLHRRVAHGLGQSSLHGIRNWWRSGWSHSCPHVGSRNTAAGTARKHTRDHRFLVRSVQSRPPTRWELPLRGSAEMRCRPVQRKRRAAVLRQPPAHPQFLPLQQPELSRRRQRPAID